MTEQRYLPLFQANGDWIERPDLFLLALMAYEDKGHDGVVEQIHGTMIRANYDLETLNSFERDIMERHLARQVRLRVFAGSTLLELIRISLTTGKAPSAAQGALLVAYNHFQATKQSSVENIEREVRKGFANFRATAHLQAAAIVNQPGLSDIEGSEENTRRFLARARGFEQLFDKNIVSRAFKWQPLRVPESIEPILEFPYPHLSSEELAAIGIG